MRLNHGPRVNSLLQSTGSLNNRKCSRQWMFRTCCDSSSRISSLCIPRLHWAPNGYNGETEICVNRYSTHAYNNATKRLCGKGKAERSRRRWEFNIKSDFTYRRILKMLCDMGRFRYVLCEDSNGDLDKVFVRTVMKIQLGPLWRQ